MKRRKKRKHNYLALLLLTGFLVFIFSGCDVEVETETYNITGEIVDNQGQGIGGVSISFGNDNETVTTSEDGKWSKGGLEGTVTVTPVKGDWAFEPESQQVKGKRNDVNFIGMEIEQGYTISGTVKDKNGAGVEGVKINISGYLDPLLTSDDGSWSKSGLEGTVTITPNKDGWAFEPENKEVSGEETDLVFVGEKDEIPVTKYTLTIQVEGEGAVNPEAGVHSFNEGTKVDLEAFPEPGRELKTWLGDLTGSDNPIEIIMDEDKEITAVFKIKQDEETGFAGGKGEHNDPYLVGTPEQLDNVRNYLNKHFLQIADIDLSDYNTGEGWEPIGDSNNPFDGIFDGDGYEITNLFINRPDTDNIGLFGRGLDNSQFISVSILDANITGGNWTGALIGFCRGDILNSYVDAVVKGGDYHSGVITGYSSGTIVDSLAKGILEGTKMVGGIVGRLYYGSISNSGSHVSVKGDLNVGGLVGYSQYSPISNSLATGNIEGIGDGSYGTNTNMGGLVGQFISTTIERCSSTGEVNGLNRIGGLVGRMSGEIRESFSTGVVKGNHYVGGMVGYTVSLTNNIEDSYSAGEVIGNSFFGGLVGQNRGKVKNSYSAVITEGRGLIGHNSTDHYGTGEGETIESFYNKEISRHDENDDESEYGIGKTTTELYDKDTYINAGWDFSSTWFIDDGNDYPKLQWEE